MALGYIVDDELGAIFSDELVDEIPALSKFNLDSILKLFDKLSLSLKYDVNNVLHYAHKLANSSNTNSEIVIGALENLVNKHSIEDDAENISELQYRMDETFLLAEKREFEKSPELLNLVFDQLGDLNGREYRSVIKSTNESLDLLSRNYTELGFDQRFEAFMIYAKSGKKGSRSYFQKLMKSNLLSSMATGMKRKNVLSVSKKIETLIESSSDSLQQVYIRYIDQVPASRFLTTERFVEEARFSEGLSKQYLKNLVGAGAKQEKVEFYENLRSFVGERGIYILGNPLLKKLYSTAKGNKRLLNQLSRNFLPKIHAAVAKDNGAPPRWISEIKKAADGDSSGLIKRMNDCFEEDKFQKRVVDLQDQKFREINNHFLDTVRSFYEVWTKDSDSISSDEFSSGFRDFYKELNLDFRNGVDSYLDNNFCNDDAGPGALEVIQNLDDWQKIGAKSLNELVDESKLPAAFYIGFSGVSKSSVDYLQVSKSASFESIMSLKQLERRGLNNILLKLGKSVAMLVDADKLKKLSIIASREQLGAKIESEEEHLESGSISRVEEVCEIMSDFNGLEYGLVKRVQLAKKNCDSVSYVAKLTNTEREVLVDASGHVGGCAYLIREVDPKYFSIVQRMVKKNYFDLRILDGTLSINKLLEKFSKLHDSEQEKCYRFEASSIGLQLRRYSDFSDKGFAAFSEDWRKANSLRSFEIGRDEEVSLKPFTDFYFGLSKVDRNVLIQEMKTSLLFGSAGFSNFHRSVRLEEMMNATVEHGPKYIQVANRLHKNKNLEHKDALKVAGDRRLVSHFYRVDSKHCSTILELIDNPIIGREKVLELELGNNEYALLRHVGVYDRKWGRNELSVFDDIGEKDKDQIKLELENQLKLYQDLDKVESAILEEHKETFGSFMVKFSLEALVKLSPEEMTFGISSKLFSNGLTVLDFYNDVNKELKNKNDLMLAFSIVGSKYQKIKDHLDTVDPGDHNVWKCLAMDLSFDDLIGFSADEFLLAKDFYRFTQNVNSGLMRGLVNYLEQENTSLTGYFNQDGIVQKLYQQYSNIPEGYINDWKNISYRVPSEELVSLSISEFISVSNAYRIVKTHGAERYFEENLSQMIQEGTAEDWSLAIIDQFTEDDDFIGGDRYRESVGRLVDPVMIYSVMVAK
ncbi:hypothetical protein HOA92_06735 [archaeon]|jgi:hypothetical protein|nr:hypothetical protein [archaeon]MBT6762708.1 hypothetical protein [archaeon]